uniref:Uncharacterized protein n=2 Tax=unclassified Caudoviricetes TaxID=2788787 RepID=A0A8S5P3Q3_9CAUD|nr:MAG TPA: hypothetical protein [Siphoviridae sp. ctkyp1]DAF65401.1 MAG TPA: hypothetical protein [Siphoviridae sp. ctbbV81]DAL19330.1 MAG TPA_asm: hypothetical protein [Caudoviricetes sp.]
MLCKIQLIKGREIVSFLIHKNMHPDSVNMGDTLS